MGLLGEGSSSSSRFSTGRHPVWVKDLSSSTSLWFSPLMIYKASLKILEELKRNLVKKCSTNLRMKQHRGEKNRFANFSSMRSLRADWTSEVRSDFESSLFAERKLVCSVFFTVISARNWQPERDDARHTNNLTSKNERNISVYTCWKCQSPSMLVKRFSRML